MSEARITIFDIGDMITFTARGDGKMIASTDTTFHADDEMPFDCQLAGSEVTAAAIAAAPPLIDGDA